MIITSLRVQTDRNRFRWLAHSRAGTLVLQRRTRQRDVTWSVRGDEAELFAAAGPSSRSPSRPRTFTADRFRRRFIRPWPQAAILSSTIPNAL